MSRNSQSIFAAPLLLPALGEAVTKLKPASLWRNPVMFTTAVVAMLLTALLFVADDRLSLGFRLQLIV